MSVSLAKYDKTRSSTTCMLLYSVYSLCVCLAWLVHRKRRHAKKASAGICAMLLRKSTG
jgi:uncharacterized membrane protein